MNPTPKPQYRNQDLWRAVDQSAGLGGTLDIEVTPNP